MLHIGVVMNAERKFAPDVERLTTLIKHPSLLVDNHSMQNYLKILMFAMIRGDEWPQEFCTAEELADTPELIRKHRTHVLSLGSQLGMTLLAQLICHDQTAVWRTTGETVQFQKLRRVSGHASEREEREVYAGLLAATPVDSFGDLIETVRSNKCHSAVIVGCSTIGSRTFTDHCLRELRQVMPVHGRIYIIG